MEELRDEEKSLREAKNALEEEMMLKIKIKEHKKDIRELTINERPLARFGRFCSFVADNIVTNMNNQNHPPKDDTKKKGMRRGE